MAELIRGTEVVNVPDVLVEEHLADGWTHVTETDAADLDVALEAFGLSTRGKDADKHKRLAKQARKNGPRED